MAKIEKILTPPVPVTQVVEYQLILTEDEARRLAGLVSNINFLKFDIKEDWQFIYDFFYKVVENYSETITSSPYQQGEKVIKGLLNG